MNSEISQYFKGNYNFVVVALLLSFVYFYLTESPKTYQQKQRHQSNSLKNCAFVCSLVAFALYVNLNVMAAVDPYDMDLSSAVDLVSQGARSAMDEFIPGPANF